MTQAQCLILLFKVGSLGSALALTTWGVQWTLLSRGENWRNPFGRSFMYETVLFVLVLFFTILSLFWDLNRLTSEVIGWTEGGLLVLIALLIFSRLPLTARMYRRGQELQPHADEDSTKP